MRLKVISWLVSQLVTYCDGGHMGIPQHCMGRCVCVFYGVVSNSTGGCAVGDVEVIDSLIH